MTAVILRGDARSLPLPDESVDLIVTSPPYWSLRDYRDGGESLTGQIGNEPTWQEYIANLLDCTREWMRVLKPGGSLFVVIGDKYANDAKWGGATSGKHVGSLHGQTGIGRAKVRTGIPAKSLIGLPWRYALACVDELGLILRAENIWAKANGLPESSEDRTCRAHEQAFHFTRQGRYFAAVDEIREPHQPQSIARAKRNRLTPDLSQPAWRSPNTLNPADACHPLGRLPRSVWHLASAPLFVPEHIEHARCCGGRKRSGCTDGLDHHAAFPPALARQCVLGWSPSGICTKCGEGRRPVVTGGHKGDGAKPHKAALRVSSFDWAVWKAGEPHRITGYVCACLAPDAPTRPALVVDPFGGTGTTALVADVLGRTAITFDLSADYCRLARWRTTDPGERARALGVPKPPPVADGQMDLFGGAA